MITAVRLRRNPSQPSLSDRISSEERRKKDADEAGDSYMRHSGGLSRGGAWGSYRGPSSALISDALAAYSAGELPEGMLNRVGKLANLYGRPDAEMARALSAYDSY